jgi:hypothetical protein
MGYRIFPISPSTFSYIFWCGRRDLNPQAFWALAPKASVFAISPLPHIANGSPMRVAPPSIKSSGNDAPVAMPDGFTTTWISSQPDLVAV